MQTGTLELPEDINLSPNLSLPFISLSRFMTKKLKPSRVLYLIIGEFSPIPPPKIIRSTPSITAA